MFLLAKNTSSQLTRRNGLILSQFEKAASTNAAMDLHHHFWDSLENRSLMLGKQCEEQKDLKDYSRAQDQLMKNAHEDLFKHFRVTASLRAMKRGDGILSNHFNLNDVTFHEKSQALPYVDREMTLIDVETSKKACQDMHRHFRRAHETRRDAAAAQNPVDEEDRIQDVKSNKHDEIVQHAVHPDRRRSRAPLPSTLADIEMEFGHHVHHSKHQAIAITETKPPFKIVDVNKAWVDLCGYPRKHAIGSTLKILQGPETNTQAANALVSSLLAGKDEEDDREYETVLTNYRSDGRRFRNHVRVGLLRDGYGKVVYFVGCFKRLDDDDEMII